METYTSALIAEMTMQSAAWSGHSFNTVYFGGGTPSKLTTEALNALFKSLHQHFKIDKEAEITFECNPEDISAASLNQWASLGINRLSVGIQSLKNEDLKWMNRGHSAEESLTALNAIQNGPIRNYSVDLIFGLPNQYNSDLSKAISQLLAFKPMHFSCYALTVEPQTPLAHMVQKQRIHPANDEQTAAQYFVIESELVKAGFNHYEVSNYALDNNKSLHNSNYWAWQPYLGLGPGAHGFDGLATRFSNPNNLKGWAEHLESGDLACIKEQLSDKDRFNEMVLTGLRTDKGLSLMAFKKRFEKRYIDHLVSKAKAYKAALQLENDTIKLLPEKWLFADHFAAELFWLDKD